MIPNPCKDCDCRKSECAVNCTEWKEYTEKRNEQYSRKKMATEADAYKCERSKNNRHKYRKMRK
jgi:hypothetical protein